MNTLESRLDRIELQNQGNQFKHAIDKITRKGCKVINTTPFHFKKFEFNGNLHSNHIENEKFTNFIKTKGNMYYSVLEKTIDKIYSENYNFLKEFQLEENNYSEISEATQRLKRIIMEVNNIKNIAHLLDMKTVIEGVETEEQFNTLSEIGCDYFQGYYFSKPVPLDELKKALSCDRTGTGDNF